MRFRVSYIGGPVGPPPPSMVFVGLFAPWMELSARSEEGLSPGGGVDLAETLTASESAVTFCKFGRFC
ncbi:hypothetical protein FHT44_002157 [Mycolicibacterium sp. BK634]|nr:hypothetical protein [Mycolicibacterium sp. BK634]